MYEKPKKPPFAKGGAVRRRRGIIQWHQIPESPGTSCHPLYAALPLKGA